MAAAAAAAVQAAAGALLPRAPHVVHEGYGIGAAYATRPRGFLACCWAAGMRPLQHSAQTRRGADPFVCLVACAPSALWLVPRGAAGERLSALVARLAPTLPCHHTPHATLRCHLGSVAEARAVAATVAAAVAPFELRVAAAVEACHVHYTPAADAGADTCRAVHATVSGAGFAPAWRVATAALRGSSAADDAAHEPHAPHVSLAYRYGAPYSVEEVAELHALAAGDSECAFVVDRIVVATTRGLWPTWEALEEIPLRGGSDAEAAPAEAVPREEEDA
jgi:hypothetical protein